MNLTKCAFGVESGKFLGFMVNHRGIEVNPTKAQVVVDLQSLRTIKEVQRLIGIVGNHLSVCVQIYRQVSPILPGAPVQVKDQLGS